MEPTLEFAKQLDAQDTLREFRDEFVLPGSGDQTDIYFVGNSLGLMPRRTEKFIQQELELWGKLGVRGHFMGEHPWLSYHETVAKPMAAIVGAQENEVVTMNALTVNLHLMMATFYRPTDRCKKILIEKHAFPSDKNAVESQIRLHGLDPAECLVELEPDDGELFSTHQVMETIHRYRETLALILLPGVQYYTGQVFDMELITTAAHQHEILIGFDLAHAAGNIPLELHDWDVDFACWCTYKYLNSGPGALAGCFIHEQHATDTSLDRLAGWWGHDKESRFKMDGSFSPIPTAEGWQLSNPPILSMAAVRASLEIFDQVGGIAKLNEKSRMQGEFFRACLAATMGVRVNVIAPPDVSGFQLSLEVQVDGLDGKQVYEQLETSGVRADWREPNVIRAAPTPLYNTFEEIWNFVELLDKASRS